MAPWFFGYLGAAGAGSGGAFELIETARITSSGNVSFTNIPDTYKHLTISFSASLTVADARMLLRFNNDGGNNYQETRMLGNTTSISGTTNSTISYALFGYGSGTNGLSNSFAAGEILIPNYSGSQKKTFKTDFGLADNNSWFTGIAGGWWDSTAAINSIQLFTAFGNFNTNTRFSLYGWNG